MADETMVVTVGLSPAPVLLTICHHAPGRVWLVHSRDSETVAADVARTLAQHRPDMAVELLDVGAAPGDPAAVRAALATARGPAQDVPGGAGAGQWPPAVPWRCDYTGGTAVMAVELAAAHARAHPEGRAELRSYWDETADLVRYDTGRAARCTVPAFYNLATIAILHGFTIRALGTRPDLSDRDGARGICDYARAKLRGQPTPPVPRDWSGTADTKYTSRTLPQLTDSKSPSGPALEVVVAATVAETAARGVITAPDELAIGFEVLNDRIELDVVGRWGQRVVVLSCKNNKMESKPSQPGAAVAAGRVHYEAQAIFGAAARRAVVAVIAKNQTAETERTKAAQATVADLTDLLFGPGLVWRSPAVFSERDVVAMLAPRWGTTPRLAVFLARGLTAGATVTTPPRSPVTGVQQLRGHTLVTTLSGNVLATVASGRGLAPDSIVVLTSSDRDMPARAGWHEELRACFEAPEAAVYAVPVELADSYQVAAALREVLAAAPGPVTLDLTGGTKAVSVAAHSAWSTVNSGDVGLCYSDVRSGMRRWFGTGRPAQPLRKLSADLHRLLSLRGNVPANVVFTPVTLDELAVTAHANTVRLATLVSKLDSELGGVELLRPRLRTTGGDWLPKDAVVLVTEDRVIGCYGHDNLTTVGVKGGLDTAIFVDALVTALGGDLARSIFYTPTPADDAAKTQLRARLRKLIRKPFPPRMLWPDEAEAVLSDPAARAELTTWMTT